MSKITNITVGEFEPPFHWEGTCFCMFLHVSTSDSAVRIKESITLFFMTESGIIKDWNPRMSGLVARLMEVRCAKCVDMC